MVLYLENLKVNCENYISLAELVARVLRPGDMVYEEINEAVGVCRANIETIDSLLGEGMTEIHVK